MLCDVPFFRHSQKGDRGFYDLSVFRYSLNGGLWVMSQFCTITQNVPLPNFSKAQRSHLGPLPEKGCTGPAYSIQKILKWTLSLKVLAVVLLLVIITLPFLTGINDDVTEKGQRLQFSEIANLVPGTESLSSAITARKKQIKISTMNT